jgi:hypothetical protein
LYVEEDFHTLQPKSSDDDDYASVLLATVELTQLLHNVHDTLYSSASGMLAMIRMDDYSLCLNDFIKSLLACHERWLTLTVCPALHSNVVSS